MTQTLEIPKLVVGGRGSRGTPVLDRGPYEMGEIALLFRDLPIDQLAGSWVAVMVDSLSEWRPPLGAFARSLCVVAERLHGAPFKIQYVQETPLMTQALANPAGFTVCDGPMPAAKPGAVRGKTPLTAAISALKPGQYVKVSPETCKLPALRARVKKIAKESGYGDELYVYEAANGDLIVACDKTDDV